jgi:hypothetical protein
MDVSNYSVNGIGIVTYNLHGFENSWDYLHLLTLSYDIIFLQEHWLMPTKLYMLQNVSDDFLVFAKSSTDEKLKQGILVGRHLVVWQFWCVSVCVI